MSDVEGWFEGIRSHASNVPHPALGLNGCGHAMAAVYGP